MTHSDAMSSERDESRAGKPVPPCLPWAARISGIGLLVVGCVIPFVLRNADARWEPYPALLLPSGASTIRIDTDRIKTSKLEVLTVSSDGTEHELSPAAFFAPLPEQYWRPVALAGFGLEPQVTTPAQLTLGTWTFTIQPRSPPSAFERDQVHVWLRQRLFALGRGNDHLLRLRVVRLILSANDPGIERGGVLWTHDISF